MNTKRLFIAGKNNIACNILKKILEKTPPIQVLAITNRTDSGEDGWQRSFLKLANKLQVPTVPLEAAYSDRESIFLSLEFDRIITPEKFSTTKLYNIHFSLLPAYKGMFTSALPILHGASKTGVTLHKIDRGIDTGDIISQEEIHIHEEMICSELYEKYIEVGTRLVENHLDELIFGEPASQPQQAKGASYYSKQSIDYQKVHLDTNKTAYEIKKQIQAYNHRFYQLIDFQGSKIIKATITEEKSTSRPGTIIEESKNSITISTIDYNITLHKDKLDEILKACATNNKIDTCILKNNINSINEKNKKGWSPLIVAAYHNNKIAVEQLLKLGANPNDTNFKGTSVIMYAKDGAIKTNDKTSFRLLLQNGANLELKDHQDKTIFEYIDKDTRAFLGI